MGRSACCSLLFIRLTHRLAMPNRCAPTERNSKHGRQKELSDRSRSHFADGPQSARRTYTQHGKKRLTDTDTAREGSELLVHVGSAELYVRSPPVGVGPFYSRRRFGQCPGTQCNRRASVVRHGWMGEVVLPAGSKRRLSAA